MPCEVLSKVSTLAQSVMLLAVVAILATSAPDDHICCKVLSRAASEGVSSKLCEDRITFVFTGS